LCLGVGDMAMEQLAAVGEAPGVSAVHVNLTPHPKILHATQKWLDTFALTPQACYGRSLTTISGPNTVWQRLSAAMGAARSGKPAAARVVLYSSTGESALYSVSALPSQAPGQQPALKLCMRRTDAVSYKVAAADDGQCSLLVRAERPFRITWLSAMFERRFGLKADDVISRTLSIIRGPQTDVRAWLELIDGALAGCSTNGVIRVYMREGTAATEAICCTPVLGKDDIEFVRITIGTTPTIAITRSRSASPARAVVEPSQPRRCSTSELEGRTLTEKAASKAGPSQTKHGWEMLYQYLLQGLLDDVRDGGPRDRPQVRQRRTSTGSSTQDVQMPRHGVARAPILPNAVRNILRTQEIVADLTRTPPRAAKNARSTSMATVKKYIAFESRRQQQEARLLETEEAEEGLWAWLLSLMMTILVCCNLMSPPMPCQSRARKGAPSRYSNIWMHIQKLDISGYAHAAGERCKGHV